MKKGGVLFGGVFFLAGLVVLYFTVISPIIDASRMQFWHATSAQLLSAEVSSYESRNDDGRYTTMYKADIQYQYNLAGNSYLGRRAKIRNNTSSSDSSDAYSLLSKVKLEQKSKNSITIWYNPNNINESIYDRTLGVQFLLIMTFFSGLFITIGIGIIAYSRPEKEQKPVNATPAKPWTMRLQWASPVIYSSAQTKIKYAWYFALLSALFFGMFSLVLFGKHPVATAFALLLLVVPLWLSLRAKRIQKEWQHFKEVPLKLGSYPGVIGGKVNGSLIIPGQIISSQKCIVTLKCTHYWTRRSGSKTQSSSSVIFSKEQKIIAKPNSKQRGADITFSFDVPADKPQSSAPSNNYYKWSVVIQGNVTALNFEREYEIPVFITQESMTVEEELEEKPLTLSERKALDARLNLELNSVKDELILHTPGSQTSLWIAGIGAVFFISGVLIATLGGSFFGVIFAAMSCIFLALGIWGYGRNCKIHVKPNVLQVDVYFFSKHIHQLLFKKADISDIEVFSSSKVHTNGKQTSEKFCLRLFTDKGKNIDLGGDFTTMKKAIYIKQRIEQYLGLLTK